jgi:hypothetical protein
MLPDGRIGDMVDGARPTLGEGQSLRGLRFVGCPVGVLGRVYGSFASLAGLDSAL